MWNSFDNHPIWHHKNWCGQAKRECLAFSKSTNVISDVDVSKLFVFTKFRKEVTKWNSFRPITRILKLFIRVGVLQTCFDMLWCYYNQHRKVPNKPRIFTTGNKCNILWRKDPHHSFQRSGDPALKFSFTLSNLIFPSHSCILLWLCFT